MSERFWDKVAKADDCWLWTGSRSAQGYGRTTRNGSSTGAHRVSWELTNGPIPDGLFVLHKCDNPPCVRPDHLFVGSAGDNARDMISKDRQGWTRGDGGSILARLPPELHERLKAEAKRQGVSMNLLIVTLLAGGIGFKMPGS